MPFTDGELNKLIDSLMHPMAREDPWFWALDGVLPGMVEQDLELTVRKFLRYNAPKIIHQVLRNQNKTRKAHDNY
jgi:hypothetical protein